MSDGVHRPVLAADSLCFVLAAQARKLSLSASSKWAEQALKGAVQGTRFLSVSFWIRHDFI